MTTTPSPDIVERLSWFAAACQEPRAEGDECLGRYMNGKDGDVADDIFDVLAQLTSARAEIERLRAEREWRPIASAPVGPRLIVRRRSLMARVNLTFNLSDDKTLDEALTALGKGGPAAMVRYACTNPKVKVEDVPLWDDCLDDDGPSPTAQEPQT